MHNMQLFYIKLQVTIFLTEQTVMYIDFFRLKLFEGHLRKFTCKFLFTSEAFDVDGQVWEKVISSWRERKNALTDPITSAGEYFTYPLKSENIRA